MEGWMTQWEEPSAQTGHTGTLVEELLVYPSPAVTRPGPTLHVRLRETGSTD